MEALVAGGSRIQDHHVQLFVVDDFEDMGMTTDEDVRAVPHNQGEGTAVVMPWIASDMGHKNLHASASEKAVQRIVVAQVVIVAVAADPDERLERGYLGCQRKSAAEVPRMPDFVYRFEECPERRIKNSVCV